MSVEARRAADDGGWREAGRGGKSLAAMRSRVFLLRAVAMMSRCRSKCEYDRRSALMPSGAQTYASVPSMWTTSGLWSASTSSRIAPGGGASDRKLTR